MEVIEKDKAGTVRSRVERSSFGLRSSPLKRLPTNECFGGRQEAGGTCKKLREGLWLLQAVASALVGGFGLVYRSGNRRYLAVSLHLGFECSQRFQLFIGPGAQYRQRLW